MSVATTTAASPAASSTAAPVPAPPGLRILPAPDCEPPYDPDGARPALRLAPAPPHPVPAGRAAPVTSRPALPPLPDGPRRHAGPPHSPSEPHAAGPHHAPGQSGPPVEMPSSRPFAMALVQRLLEVCAGVRPATQLRPDTTPELFDRLEAVLVSRPRATGLRPTRRDIVSVHVQQRPEGVSEVCATVRRGGRAGALALRLEVERGRWTCTELVGL